MPDAISHFSHQLSLLESRLFDLLRPDFGLSDALVQHSPVLLLGQDVGLRHGPSLEEGVCRPDLVAGQVPYITHGRINT